MHDIRWKQRHANFTQALRSLDDAIRLAGTRPLSDLEQQGLIQAFEFTHELAWKTLKDYLEAQGIQNLIGSRNTTREAFKNALIADGEAWMAMIEDRNLTSHAYDHATADAIASRIIAHHGIALLALEKTFAGILENDSAHQA